MEHRLKKDERALREAIREELGNAVENGENFEGWTSEQIAEDMNRYCSTVEGVPESELLPHIVEWRKERTQ